ncbi:pyridine nucleotide-disulfide oxidoreductase [Trypanosoma brucei equiperdum]|uniref:Pyridine nucleotide-disulfide oxidoreductase n=1 Tax=Trypanosoma brucei equiperdum TaxID=630700 RepID=A0A3L6L5T9_9TRYP|nr:pyridine nucleotide-disulfide oxidoreductase [Trypanosoma brucei equiperdum]
MLWKLFTSSMLAGAVSAYRSTSSSSLAISPPTLDVVMDPSKDVTPVRCVVVGGGYTGSKLAYMLDSMFNVTFIDEKNYFELTNDIIPIIANPWSELNEEACRRLLVLHRYYLKQANVLTGTVHGVDENTVTLRDGRTVPYDLLFITVGERKPYPFATKQRTVSGRVQELKNFNEFIGTCKKVAVLGGGPVGVSLAVDLARNRKDLKVHLYHSKPELLPALPTTSQRYALETVEKCDNITVNLCSRVTDVTGYDALGRRVNETSTSMLSSLLKPLTGWLTWGTSPDEPSTFTVRYEKMHFAPRPRQSIVNQAYFGTRQPQLTSNTVESIGEEEGYDYVFSTIGDVPRPIVSGKGCTNILSEHEMPDGHYRVSTLMQLYCRPNIWAVGRCNNIPRVRGYGLSDVEARTVFRALNSVVHNPTERFMHSRDGLDLRRLNIPRMLVRLGSDDAVGSTPWSGAMVGLAAVHEFMQDRNFLVKEFQKPIFYKRQDAAKVKQRISNWAAHEITDIVDFSHC